MYVDITKQSKVTCVEWFHGYGGNAIGLRGAIPGLRSIAVCERDAFVVANMVSKMEKGLLDAVPIWTDVTDFPTEPFGYQQLDLFIASYPCQGFSHAGKRLGADDHRHLWPYCRKFIGAVRPRYVWLENVEGHVSLGLSTVLADLEEDGYTAAWGVFSASEVGAPHQRKRVFILAYDKRGGRGEGGECSGMEGISRTKQDHAGSVEKPDTRTASGGEDVAHSQVHDGGHEPKSGEALRPELRGYLWPSRPGRAQYGWEPPRVVGNAEKLYSTGSGNKSGGGGQGSGEVPEPGNATGYESGSNGGSEIKSPMGGNSDGPAAGLDIAGCTGLGDTELEEIHSWMVKGTNRTDELRMCGNGVVPQTAERAFRTLYAELKGLSGTGNVILEENLW